MTRLAPPVVIREIGRNLTEKSIGNSLRVWRCTTGSP